MFHRNNTVPWNEPFTIKSQRDSPRIFFQVKDMEGHIVLTDYIIQYASECKQYIFINTVIIFHWGRTIWREKRWLYLCSLGNLLNRQSYTACCDKQIQTSTESALQYWCSGLSTELQYMYQAHKYRPISNCSHCKFVIYS